MYLKALELHGFKSFPDKTVLHFNPGSTVIVGPNGSGKSNITDAMRWVLGEISTKNIRGSKMEDVIFVGADGHRPMSFAEVSITFDDSELPRKLNCPYEEVTVTRRYYRAGESEYFINRKPCRLKDIHELFMNTGIGREGYSIVGQGKIAEIISKKSEDRRGIFEETAGISKYRYQKNESEKKLRETEDNMTRVLDIFSEIESRVGPLEREAQKARKYLDLYEEKKKYEISVWLFDIDKLRVDVDKFSTEVRRTANELEMVEDDERSLEGQYERLFEASQENRQAASVLYDRIKDINTRIREAETEAANLEKDIAHAKALAEAADTAAEKSLEDEKSEAEVSASFKSKVDSIGAKIDETDKKLCELEEVKKKATEEKDLLDKKLADDFERIREKEAERDELRVRLDVLRNSISERSDKESSVISDVEKYEEKLASVIRDIEDSRSAVESYEAALKKSDEEIEKCDRQYLSLSDKAAGVERELSSFRASSEALHSRIAALLRMQEHFDGYNNSVKFVMQSASEGKLKGVHGPVSTLVKVSDKYTVALETAFGSNLQNIVVDDEKAAKNAIYALKEAGAGRATFYPLSSVKGQSRTAELETAAKHHGFIGYADELLDCDDKYREVISSIIGRIAVFDNIDNASDVARKSGWKLRIVTLDGQQINMGGSFTGGSVRRDSGMLSRNAHIDKLKDEKADVDEKAEKTEKELNELRGKMTEITGFRRAEEEKAKISETLLRTERAQLDEYEATKSVTESLIEGLRADMDNLREMGEKGGKDAEALEKEIAEKQSEIDEIAEIRRETYITRNDAEDKAAEADETVVSLRLDLAGLMKDAESAANSAIESRERAAKFREESEAHRTEAENLRSGARDADTKIGELRAESDSLRKELTDIEEQRSSLEENNVEYDRKLNENRIKTKEITDKKELVLRAHTANESKLERLNSEVDKMTSKLWDEYELTFTAAAGIGYPQLSAEERPAAAKRMNELKNTVKALGNVNVGAIDEYKELKERYDYLKNQIDDLTKSKTELEGIIGSIDEEMKKMFVDAFEKINTYFGEVFRELFGGGSAHLELTDPENVLSSGVDIKVAPPGKMIKNLSLLSGGEQAFVAIALIFALIRVNPSPFCIFDEIEAALDEVNVTRVANYIKRFSKEMQIIMITHRRGMMETANTLYGVTMPRHGISKVFTLDVNAVAEDNAIAKEFVE